MTPFDMSAEPDDDDDEDSDDHDCWCMYGMFNGGDPRAFRPDPECSTPHERARWSETCAKLRGKPFLGDDYERSSGPPLPHSSHGGFGFGTYTCEQHRAANDDWAEDVG